MGLVKDRVSGANQHNSSFKSEPSTTMILHFVLAASVHRFFCCGSNLFVTIFIMFACCIRIRIRIVYW